MCCLDSALLLSYAHTPADTDDSAVRKASCIPPLLTHTRIGLKKRIAETKVGQGQYRSRCLFPDRTSSPVQRGMAGQLARWLREAWMGRMEIVPRAVRSKATFDAAHRDICALAFSTPYCSRWKASEA